MSQKPPMSPLDQIAVFVYAFLATLICVWVILHV